MASVVVVDHPVVQHKLGLLRDRETASFLFRDVLREISVLLAYEATRELSLEEHEVMTPVGLAVTRKVRPDRIAVVSVLRAGEGMREGVQLLLPRAAYGHVGLYRNTETLEAVQYYVNLPPGMSEKRCLVLDPMLATGNSAATAVTRVKEKRPRGIVFVCVLAAPEGLERFHEEHPDVTVFTGCIDDGLDSHGYIVPGLGDAGDRLFGT